MNGRNIEPLSFGLKKSKTTEYFNIGPEAEFTAPDSSLLRKKMPDLPSPGELQTVRHYTKLSNLNFGVDTGFYPLGSCTMKYNPKINEDMARLDGFTKIHPYQDEKEVQGALRLMYELGEILKQVSGMAGITLLPAAGAHGESTGLKIIDAYHVKNG
ncbi:MAG: aminomethyl-transferring glycine dehydrogenase subunit GcvPB, partial [Oligoflexia bacterium]|nr:aminomethyl-transferring glycine dehydrogenase subunit GcvPB [Oligoflexia bacterium]